MRSPSTGTVEDSSSALFRSGRKASPVEGLRMAREFVHEPVMAGEVLALFATVPAGTVVDATVGGGGHAAALLGARPDIRLLALDRDPEAVATARRRLAPFGERAEVRHARFSELGDQVVGPVAGILLDLGVSSPQLDVAGRGFSYRRDAALDMRMDPTTGATAAALVNGATVDELRLLFAANGEERLAGRIARAVAAARPITSTGQLADVVAGAVPAAVRRRGHPARRVFQALRIAVNEELEELAAALPVALDLLALGGRLVVIAYHSGEDRLVKASFADAARGGCTCPPGLPCVCGARVEHRLVFRGARKPSAAEVAWNHRAESARLRAVERVDR